MNKLAKKANENYSEYEFHNVFHDISNFCTIDLSKLYVDITKDRTYVEAPASKARRSAQTAMYTVLSALTRLLAPLLTHTAEEIWQTMPHSSGEDARSVLLNRMPVYEEKYAFDEIETHWDNLFALRDDVMKELELARAAKTIGKSLEAKLEISVGGDKYELLDSFRGRLAEVFIVSAVKLEKSDSEDMTVTVKPADGEKCDRCWMYTEDGEKTEDGYLCARCLKTLETL